MSARKRRTRKKRRGQLHRIEKKLLKAMAKVSNRDFLFGDPTVKRLMKQRDKLLFRGPQRNPRGRK